MRTVDRFLAECQHDLDRNPSRIRGASSDGLVESFLCEDGESVRIIATTAEPDGFEYLYFLCRITEAGHRDTYVVFQQGATAE